MIRLFMRQHLAWLLLLLLLQVFVNALLFLDEGIQSDAFLYLNLVWLVLVCVFCTWRCYREAQQMAQFDVKTGDYVTTVKNDYEEQLQEMQVAVQEQRLLVLEKQDELLAWVHEMKSPLTAMQLLIDKVEQPLKEKVGNEWLRLYLLLDQQLHATRLMTIEQDNRIEKVTLHEIVVGEIRALRSWCFERQIAINIEQLDIDVRTDAKWLGFIVRQILSNAVKYSHTGGEIKIYTTSHNDQVVLHIQDAGIGIRSEDLPRVFRKSYTGTIGRETSAATGMGLYLAKQSADSLHLTLKIVSELHQGTTVQITFPAQNNYVKTLGM